MFTFADVRSRSPRFRVRSGEAGDRGTANLHLVVTDRPPPRTGPPASASAHRFHHNGALRRRFSHRYTNSPQGHQNAPGGRFRPKLRHVGNIPQSDDPRPRSKRTTWQRLNSLTVNSSAKTATQPGTRTNARPTTTSKIRHSCATPPNSTGRAASKAPNLSRCKTAHDHAPFQLNSRIPNQRAAIAASSSLSTYSLPSAPCATPKRHRPRRL